MKYAYTVWIRDRTRYEHRYALTERMRLLAQQAQRATENRSITAPRWGAMLATAVDEYINLYGDCDYNCGAVDISQWIMGWYRTARNAVSVCH